MRNRCQLLIGLTLVVICMTAWTLFPNPVIAQEKWQVHDDLFSISFPTENDGWACGRWGTVLHTSDSGKTWQRQKSGTQFTLADIFFVDSENGWAVGNEGTILHTADGGNIWRSQASPVDYYHTGVCFVSKQKGWITSDQTHILYTDDGGKNWRVQFQDVEFKLKSISFADALNGWAVGEYGYVYHTQDGGISWHHQGGYLRFNEETADIEGGTFLFEVLAIDAQTAWAVGLDGHVIRTTDGGENWVKLAAGFPQTPLFCITGNERGQMAISGKGVFAISNDDGLTWEKAVVNPSIDYSWIYDVVLKGKALTAAVGEEGAIYVGTQKGHWDRVAY